MRRIRVDPDVTSVFTVSIMAINVLDTGAGMEAVLSASSDERSDVLRSMLAPVEGMFRYFPGAVDLAVMHAMSFGFPLNRCEAEVSDALGLLRNADVWARTSTAMTQAVDVQLAALPDMAVPDIEVRDCKKNGV